MVRLGYRKALETMEKTQGSGSGAEARLIWGSLQQVGSGFEALHGNRPEQWRRLK
jgi:hypothetical protein